MNEDQQRWERVGEAVRGRMEMLQLIQADVRRRSGLPDVTVRQFMTGDPRAQLPRKKTLWKLATALNWEPDWWERLDRGESWETLVRAEPDDKSALESAKNMLIFPEDGDAEQVLEVLIPQIISLMDRVDTLERLAGAGRPADNKEFALAARKGAKKGPTTSRPHPPPEQD